MSLQAFTHTRENADLPDLPRSLRPEELALLTLVHNIDNLYPFDGDPQYCEAARFKPIVLPSSVAIGLTNVLFTYWTGNSQDRPIFEPMGAFTAAVEQGHYEFILYPDAFLNLGKDWYKPIYASFWFIQNYFNISKPKEYQHKSGDVLSSILGSILKLTGTKVYDSLIDYMIRSHTLPIQWLSVGGQSSYMNRVERQLRILAVTQDLEAFWSEIGKYGDFGVTWVDSGSKDSETGEPIYTPMLTDWPEALLEKVLDAEGYIKNAPGNVLTPERIAEIREIIARYEKEYRWKLQPVLLEKIFGD